MNKHLKLALLARRAYEVAAEAGISETRLSRIVRGRHQATQDEKHRIASVLQQPVASLFPESQDR